jgi:dipeptidase E
VGDGGRILALGGHEFDRRSGNDAICDLIVDLAGSSHPRICLLPTASGDSADQISSFRRAFGDRGCEPTAISLFRLGAEQLDVESVLMAQDVIYVGGGSMVNLLAIWRAHGLDQLLAECSREGILICGQSAGAMCWFEQGVTCSSGTPRAAAGLGLLVGSACVHYRSQPERRAFYLRSVGEGDLEPGVALEDQTAALFEDGRLTDVVSAREGASVWRVEPGDNGTAVTADAAENRIESRSIEDARPAIDAVPPEIVELRQTLRARDAVGRGRIGRLD